MTRDGIEKIQEMTTRGIYKAENGREIAFNLWNYVEPYELETIEVASLTGFCSLIAQYNEIHAIIVKPFEVTCLAPLDEATKKYPVICKAKAPCLVCDSEAYQEQNEFIRTFKQNFYFDKEDGPALLKFVAHISEEHLAELTDDGISQQVVVKNGVVSLARQKIGNTMRLQSKQAFPEVPNILPYFVRLKKGGRIGLFGAHGPYELFQYSLQVAEFIKDHCGESNKIIV